MESKEISEVHVHRNSKKYKAKNGFEIEIDLYRTRNLTKFSKATLKKGYQLPEENSPQESFARASCAFADDNEHAQRLYDYVSSSWFGFATPLLANAGTKKGLPISCFLNNIEDSRKGLIDNYDENIWLSTNGGGIGTYVGNIRSLGTKTSSGNTTTGIMPFLKCLDTQILAYKQGEFRRGSMAVYLDISHPEIEEFLNMRKPSGGDVNRKCLNLHHAVNVTDKFMDCVIKGKDWGLVDPNTKKVKRKINARKLWDKILRLRIETGEPYIHFIDTSNKHLPQELKDKGLEVNHSNLCCVAGSDRVVSDRGLITVEELYKQGGELNLFDGENVVKASSMQKIRDLDKVYKITLRNGLEHTITKEHKLLTRDGIKECKDLVVGDEIVLQNKSGVFGNLDMQEEAFLLGLYQGDGTQHKDTIMLDIWENDFDLIEEVQESFNNIHYRYGCNQYDIKNGTGDIVGTRERSPATFHDCVVTGSDVKKKRLSAKTLKKSLNFKKGNVPQWIWEANEKTQWQYIRGLFYADGTTNYNDKTQIFNLAISNINKDFLKELQVLLRNLGISTGLGVLRNAGKTLLPDGRGGMKEYETKTCYRLTCGSRNEGILFEENTGFLSRKGVKIKPSRKSSLGYSEIVSIEDAGTEPVYCCHVYTNKHLWTVNGMITHNSEILLPTNPDRTAICCLSSINVEKFDEWKDHPHFVEDLVRMLDNALDAFVNRAEKIGKVDEGKNKLWRAIESAKKERSIGLGQMGLHYYLQSKGIPFESPMAVGQSRLISKHIYDRALEESKRLAKERGEAPDMKGSGLRFAHMIAIAPTASNSIICGTTPSIEPIAANAYTHKTQAGSFYVKNKYLEKVLEKYNKNEKNVWSDIYNNDGSVQHLDWMDQSDKDVFKTSIELDQNWIIEHASKRQEFICQGQSVNLFFYSDVHIAYLADVHVNAWKKGLKTLYYCRSQSIGRTGKIKGKSALEQSLSSDCTACEG